MRLAGFTSNPAPSASWGDFEVRHSAVKLKEAMEGVLKVLFGPSESKSKLEFGWKNSREFIWSLQVNQKDKEYEFPSQTKRDSPSKASIGVKIVRESTTRGSWAPWKVRSEELETLIGLCS